MKTLSFANKNNVVIVGSLRCRIADFADDFVANCHNTLLVCLGDVGLGRGNKIMQNMEIEYLERICQSNDNMVCFMRGYFDNPIFFSQSERVKHMKGLNDYLKNIHFVEDYDIIATSRGNILCVGGGSDPKTPSGYSLLDPVSTLNEGAPSSDAWFRGQEITEADLAPSIEVVEREDGTTEEVDHNEFNSWIKKSKVTIVASSVPPLEVKTSPWNEIESEESQRDREKLSKLMKHLSEIGCQVKNWYWSTDLYMPELIESDGVSFIPVLHYTSKEIA